jgi:hypothetical protein
VPPTSVRREFCRKIFRSGGADAAARSTYLDGLADIALKTQQSGKTLIGTASGGTSVQYQAFEGWRVDSLIEMLDQARSWILEDDVDAALELIFAVTSFRGDFSLCPE